MCTLLQGKLKFYISCTKHFERFLGIYDHWDTSNYIYILAAVLQYTIQLDIVYSLLPKSLEVMIRKNTHN